MEKKHRPIISGAWRLKWGYDDGARYKLNLNKVNESQTASNEIISKYIEGSVSAKPNPVIF